MNKRWVAILMCTVMVVGLCGCGAKKSTSEPTAQSSETVDSQKTSEVDQDTGMTQKEIEQAAAAVQTPESFQTIEELNQAIGYMALSLPEYWGYTIKSISFEPSTGTGGTANIDYDLDDGKKSILIISGMGEQNFSAFMGDMNETEEESGQMITYGESDDRFGAWWTDGILSYSVDTIGLTEDENERVIKELTNITADMPGGQFQGDRNVGMPNPMVEYDNFPELDEKIDFEYLYLTESDGFHCDQIFLIGETLVDLDFESKDDDEVEACVRTSKGTEDTTGYYGVEYEEVTMNEITVHKGESKGETADEYARVAWWTDGTYTYAVSFERLEDEKEFDSLLESLVERSTFINQK